MDNLVRIRGLTKHYQRGTEKIEALHGITIEIPRGDFVALMGPSGSGKTTLLNLIGGLDRPSAGELEIDGKRIDQLGNSELASWRASHVGFIFQFYNLLPMLSAQRNVELPLLLTNLSASQRKKNAAIALELVGLKDRANHKPKELSGGQEQRVAIARAIVNQPDVIIADEPTGNLDSNTGEAVERMLFELNRDQGITLVIVTHDPDLAKQCGRIIEMKDGKIVAEHKGEVAR